MRVMAAMCATTMAVVGAVVAAWNMSTPVPVPVVAVDEEVAAVLPVPPFPPRIAEGGTYEACLATLAGDPVSAVAVAEAWQADGGGEGASHCRGLALIASGKPAAGAAALEQLAQSSVAPELARASVLGQAGQARLMVGQSGAAVSDATAALALAPGDIELMILRAAAAGMMDRLADAAADLTEALRLDPERSDALVARAVVRRKLDQLDLAQDDVSQALALDPDDADALLERGILRQRMGDMAGARADWERARGVDPNSTTADLAEQNLSLLEAGPLRQ